MAVCLFDLDGVLTETASVHAKAWKATFDAYLEKRSRGSGETFTPFDITRDYELYVDGKPRYDGVRAFLESRQLRLPEGSPKDSPEAETIYGLGNLKNQAVQRLLQEEGVDAYPGSVRYLEAVHGAGLALAVVSSSANCRQVLRAAGIEHFFRAIVDGVVIARSHLPGKPAPDTFLAAARELAAEPGRAAVFEDAIAGVEAGRAGDFAFVVGVDRAGQPDKLREKGADVVVSDLSEMLRL